MREVLGSNPDRALYFPPPRDICWLSVGPCSDCEQHRDSLVFVVPARFRADSGTYLFKQGGRGIVTGRSSGSSARMVWETSWVRPGRTMCFFLLCDVYSMTSFDVEVIEINIITQDSVLAYKNNHTVVGAKITQESLDVLSHFCVNTRICSQILIRKT